MLPLIGGLCLTADFNQMWPKLCPSLEDFVTQWTSIKCGPNCAPHWRTLSRSGQKPNVAQNVPLLEDFVTQQTLTKCGPNCAPHRRTLSRSGLQPNAAQIVPLIGGLCHAADFNQMWPKLCPSPEDFVTQRTLTKCCPKCAPRWRALSLSGLLPNVVKAYAPCWRILSHS
jgi:hypothetical protein